MWIAVATYTILIVTLNITANVNTNLFEPGFDFGSLTAQDIKDREYGSKMVLVVEQMQCITIWMTKACILIMYMRLTKGRFEHHLVKGLAAYTGISFLLMEILYLGVWCRPFHAYWYVSQLSLLCSILTPSRAVPTQNAQCNTALHHLITNAVFNLSSDLILLCIAIPMFLRTQMPARKKAALISIFSLGIFVIISATLSKYSSFTNPYSANWSYWYARESSTSMLVANIPFVYTLMRRVFNLRSLDSTNAYGSRTRSKRTGGHTANTANGTVRDRMNTLLSRNRDDDEAAILEPNQSNPFTAMTGITKEVGVTFVSRPAWLDEAKGGKGNMVTITAGEVSERDIEMAEVGRGQAREDGLEYGLSEGMERTGGEGLTVPDAAARADRTRRFSRIEEGA